MIPTDALTAASAGQSEVLLISRRAEGSLFSNSAISSHLKTLGYPESSLLSMQRCGVVQGHMLANCECSSRIVELKYRCNHRECFQCSKIRKKRIKDRYLPFFKNVLDLPIDHSGLGFYFLTISPKNYDSCDQGQNDVKKVFARFLRLKYVKERILGGLSVVETTENGKGWHVHLHILYYGRQLDNRIRGKCLECGQNLIKFDYSSKKYYCASRKCNSLNVAFKKDSNIVSLWKKSANNREVNIHISKLPTIDFALNYLLKYVSVNGESFSSDFNFAMYIFDTQNRRLINTFGLFYGKKVPKPVCFCKKCNTQIEFIYDYELIEIIMKNRANPPPLDIFSY